MAKKNSVAVNEVKATANKKKWWNKKKVIAVSIIGVALLAAIIFASVIIATTAFPIGSTKEESRVVGTFGGYEVKYEELRYVTLVNKSELDSEMGKYETLSSAKKAEYEKLLRERVLEDIKNNYAILLLCDEYGIDTGSIVARLETQKMIQTLINDEFGGDISKYKEWLGKTGVTDSFLRFTYRVGYFEEKLYDHFVENKINIEYDDKNFEGFIDYVCENDDWARTIHAYYPKQWEYATAGYDAKARADAAYAKIMAAEGEEGRRAAMNSAIGSAPMINGFSIVNSDGVYFTHGQMGDVYEDAAFELDVNGISTVIETETGYYIIMRLPVEREYVDLHAAELLTQYRYAALKLKIDEKMADMSFDGNDYFDGLSLVDIK